jgi:hypothetical protein
MRRIIFLCLPIAIPVLYILFEIARNPIDDGLSLINLYSTQKVNASDMTSLFEVSIGFNLALSFLTSFSEFIGAHFEGKVNDFDPDKSPTFLESMMEAAAKSGEEMGTELQVAPLQEKYMQHVRQQVADFRKDCMNSAWLMKVLGVFTSVGSFVLLVGTAKSSDTELPLSLFWLTIFALLLPIFTHFVTVACQYLQYWVNVADVNVFNRQNGNGAVYKAFIKEVRKIHKEKRRTNAAVNVRLGNTFWKL